ncbi:TIGR04140 family protein [Thermococcus aggregans]|uniref:TIGR04140 family protein n=1 Tax=Thermococcus aggregans TaxID=110163 RepID=A0A9E7MXF7_THEAG|nr:TIGR04140 family protein [Thermococcus aggregans]USS40726.1 TIGR04140 family protein [Thermococcus aggregans]
MRKKLITALPPEEILRIKDTSKAQVKIKIREVEAYFGVPRWEVVIEGTEEEVEKFMNVLMRSRGGG